MSTDAQVYFNVAIGLFGALGGWILNSLRDSIKALHDSDSALTSKLQEIEVLVAGKYATNDSIEKISNALFVKLDKIDTKLDSKTDRAVCYQNHQKG